MKPAFQVKHMNNLCDGPLCNTAMNCLKGDRYRCIVCDDYDLCAQCEALPTSHHDPSHVMLKMKVPYDVKALDSLLHDKGKAITNKESCDKKLDGPVEDLVSKMELQLNLISIPLLALYIGDTIKDGSQMEANTIFIQSWRFRNIGATPWPAGVHICFDGGANMLSDCISANSIVEKVEPLGEAVFSIEMKSPSTESRYVSNFRLTTAEGKKFGSKVWCDIVVTLKDTDMHSSSQMIFPRLETESPILAKTDEKSDTATISLKSPADTEVEVTEVSEIDSESYLPLSDDEYEVLDYDLEA